MYLKALEIQGFKSFPDKTRLTFERNVTAIVGPNGAGKSNISDAILWVMGEQSSKTLRGGKMQDIIFGGTAARGSMGFAQVSLVIDNSGGILASDTEEVSITRKYYRSGESEYYINREAVRLKDVNELLMDTGLGRDGYSIIGQGRIADIVSGKSVERREVLEEAAGISRYRYRKEESERKLRHTEENLLRINDKIDELQYQVGPLREQAEIAKRYLVLRDELREAEVSLWMQTLDKLHEQAETVNSEYDAARSGLEAAKRELEEIYAKSEDLARIMREKDVEAEETRAKLSKTEAAAAECEAAAAVMRANIRNSAERIEQLRAETATRKEREHEISGQIETKRIRINEIDFRAKELVKAEASAQNVIDGHRFRVQNREADIETLSEALTKHIIDLRSADSRIAMLAEMEKEYEGFGNAVKTVMREVRHGALKGIHGTVAELIKADQRCALAVETALGGAIQDIVVDTQADGRAAIELLKRKDSGRGTFLPLDTIHGSRLEHLHDEEGCIGLAVDLVQFESKYKNVIENLLGRTLVAETLADAIAISKKNGNRLRIVTLDGQLINAGGSMTGGSAAKGTGILSRANELENLNAGRGALIRKRDELSSRAESLRRELSAERLELETASEDLQAVRNEKVSLSAERKANENTAAELELLRRNIYGDMDSSASAARDIEAGANSLRKELEEKETRIAEYASRAEKLKADISSITARKLEVEGKRTRADREVQEKNSGLLDMERTCARFEQKKLAAEMEEKQIIDKLWDGYQLSHSGAQAIRKPVENMAKASRQIAELKREMSSLGNPNLGAIDEYARVSERYEFLISQRDDIDKARREIVKIISDIADEMKAVFSREFKTINECFVQTFAELFGGGRAELVLEDSDNVLECDIEIRVQPPGKALSTLSLLSGGEMAFVAIALYFAIIKVRPTPFCVMDEIEAALDEANVTRFADYMRRISGKTQFIVITHRRGTMEEADELYGVTMQEKGVSRVIELDLAEAEKHIDEGN